MDKKSIVNRVKETRLKRGYIFEAEYTANILGQEKVIKRSWAIPLDPESRVDMLGLMERARSGESIKYTFNNVVDVVFSSSEFLNLANNALNLYSKIHHLSKEALPLEGEDLSKKLKELQDFQM